MIIAVLAAAVGCKAKVDTRGFEDTVRQQTSGLGLHATKVECPKDVEAKPGATFICQVELDGKKTYALDVTVKDLDKDRKLQLDTAWRGGLAIVIAKLEQPLAAELSGQLGNPVTIECGDEPLGFLDPQHKLKCELSAGEVKSTATIDFNDKLEPTGWHLDPALLGRAKLEALLTPSVREKTTPTVTVDCGPAPFLVRPADGWVWCSVSDAGKQAKIKIEVDEKLDVHRWEVVEPPG